MVSRVENSPAAQYKEDTKRHRVGTIVWTIATAAFLALAISGGSMHNHKMLIAGCVLTPLAGLVLFNQANQLKQAIYNVKHFSKKT